MAELKTNKYLIYAVIVLIAVVAALIFFNKENANKLLIFFAVAAVVIWWLFFRKKQREDVYSAIQIILMKHKRQFGNDLDDSNIEATEMPLNSGRFLIEFKNNAITYEYKEGLILGVQIKQVASVRQDMERSRIVEKVAEYGNIKEEIKKGADALNIAPESIGMGVKQ